MNMTQVIEPIVFDLSSRLIDEGPISSEIVGSGASVWGVDTYEVVDGGFVDPGRSEVYFSAYLEFAPLDKGYGFNGVYVWVDGTATLSDEKWHVDLLGLELSEVETDIDRVWGEEPLSGEG